MKTVRSYQDASEQFDMNEHHLAGVTGACARQGQTVRAHTQQFVSVLRSHGVLVHNVEVVDVRNSQQRDRVTRL
jgi:hypothetical protein